MPAGYSFRPRLWAFILTAVLSAGFIALGNWQADRAQEKRVLGLQLARALELPAIEIGSAPVDPEEVALRRVAARGRFLDEHTVFLDNKLRGGRPGYEVITPMRLNGTHVLVNRGWVPAGRTREVAPAVRVPEGEVRVEGLALPRLPQALTLGPQPAGKVRQNIDLREFAHETGLGLQPVVIEQHSPAPDALLRDWPRPDLGIDKHRAYALQWYAFAVLGAALFLVLSFRRVGPR